MSKKSKNFHSSEKIFICGNSIRLKQKTNSYLLHYIPEGEVFFQGKQLFTFYFQSLIVPFRYTWRTQMADSNFAKFDRAPAHSPVGIEVNGKRPQVDKCGAHDLIASSDQQRSQHSAPAEFGEAGGATNEPASQRWQARPRAGRLVGAEPVRQAEARLGAFARQARAPARCGSGEKGRAWRSGMNGSAMISPTQRHLAALLRRTHARNDSFIRSSRPEMTPKPRPSVVCAAKGNGDEGFRAARKGEGFCFRFCRPSCIALYSKTTKE